MFKAVGAREFLTSVGRKYQGVYHKRGARSRRWCGWRGRRRQVEGGLEQRHGWPSRDSEVGSMSGGAFELVEAGEKKGGGLHTLPWEILKKL